MGKIALQGGCAGDFCLMAFSARQLPLRKLQGGIPMLGGFSPATSKATWENQTSRSPPFEATRQFYLRRGNPYTGKPLSSIISLIGHVGGSKPPGRDVHISSTSVRPARGIPRPIYLPRA